MIIKVHGNPVSQGRPRFYRRGGFVGVYDPEKSKSWKENVRWQATKQGAKCLEGALSLHANFFLQRPKSLSKKAMHHVKKPDLDNLLKAVKDGLKGVCYKDDSQIVQIFCTKSYASDFVGVFISIQKIK